MNRRILIPVVAAALLAAATIPATRGPNESHMGVHVRTPIRDSLLVMMDRAGAEWVRWSFYWANVEDGQGNFDFSAYSDDIRTLYNNGKKILAVIANSRPTHVQVPWDNADYDEYKDLLTAIESTFGDTIDHYEVWNEAFNEAGDTLLFSGTQHDLIELVEHAHEAVGSGNTILCCGFQDVPDSLDDDFVSKFADSVGSDLDVITLHYYTTPAAKDSLPAFVQEIRTDDSNAHPIWVTEVGVTNEFGTPPYADDGELLDYVFTKTAQTTGWEKSFLYTFDGDDTASNRRLLEGNDSVYTTIHYESFCRMVREAGNLGAEPICTSDLGLNFTTLPPNTVCSMAVTWNGTATAPDFTIQANEPLYGVSDGDQYFQVETEDKNFDITVTIDGYHTETIPITVSSGAFCPS